MPFVPLRRLRTLALAVLSLALALAVGAGAPSAGHAQIAAKRAAATQLRDAVAAETRRIDATAQGLEQAQQRLAALQARVQRRQAQLAATENRLVRARIRLTRLQRKAALATATLSRNLVTTYKVGSPSVVSVVMDAHGFKDLIERVGFFKRVANRNANILDATRETKRAVAHQTVQLGRLRVRFASLSRQAVGDRNQASVLRNALLRRQAGQLRRRAGARSRLVAVRGQIDRLEREQAAAAAAAARQATATRQAPSPTPAPSSPSPSSPSSSSSPASSSGPSDASGAVAKVVAAANEIASTPYVWGGGHGGASGGYDCSGSLSYALAAAGLVSGPLTSGAFMSWGEPGPGQHITVYANAGHAFMFVDGRSFDTSALSGGGTRWTSASRSTAGFVARHPPGL